jgi:hypothetical protein
MPPDKRHNKSSTQTRKGLAADASLRKHLVDVLTGGNAHVRTFDALEGIPPAHRGVFVKGLPHTAWQLAEHLRLAQWDIVEFSQGPKHVSPEFPDGYWPRTAAPASDSDWKKTVEAIARDLKRMVRMVANRKLDLHRPFPWGDGQTLLREALLLADHNAYHVGQIVDLRKALGNWPNS